MHNTGAVAKETHLRSQGDAPSQGGTTWTPTVNSTTGGHKAREPGLRQARAPALQIRRSAIADGARQKARAQTDRQDAGRLPPP